MLDPFQVSDPQPAPMIGAVGYVPDPEPAPMMGIAPGRADFPGAIMRSQSGSVQAPSGDYQTFNEPEPGPGGLKSSDLKEAMAVVQSAMRVQGGRALAEELQNGIPLEAALLKHGDKIFYNAPAQFASAMMKMRGSAGATGPVMGVPIINPSTGQPDPDAYAVRGGGNTVHIKQAVSEATAQAKAAAREAEKIRGEKRRNLNKQFDAATATLLTIPKASPRYAPAKAAVDALQKQIDALSAAGTSTNAAPPRVIKWEDFLQEGK